MDLTASVLVVVKNELLATATIKPLPSHVKISASQPASINNRSGCNILCLRHEDATMNRMNTKHQECIIHIKNPNGNQFTLFRYHHHYQLPTSSKANSPIVLTDLQSNIPKFYLTVQIWMPTIKIEDHFTQVKQSHYRAGYAQRVPGG